MAFGSNRSGRGQTLGTAPRPAAPTAPAPPPSTYDYGELVPEETYASTDPFAMAAAQVQEANLSGASDAEVMDYIRQHYSPTQVRLLEVPELRDALMRSVREGHSPEQAMVEIEKTQWWQQRSESMRTFDLMAISDPAEFQAQVDRRMASLVVDWERYGVNADMRQAAADALRLGYTDDQVRLQMADMLQQESNLTGLDPGSQGAVDADRLQQIARMEYLMVIDPQTAERWAIKGIRGNQDIEDEWRSYLSSIASARFGIDPNSGITPADVMAPVRSAIAQELEIAPDSIDLLEPDYAEVVSYDDNGRIRPMTHHEAVRWARRQPGWRNTGRANDLAASTVRELGERMGAIAG